MQARTYVLRSLLYCLIVAGLVVLLNAAVDPYAMVGTARIPGFNQYKVDINEHTRQTKKYQPLFAQYNALIVGNSRVELGIRPTHPCFLHDGMTVYNLGIPGAEVRTQLEYALNVIYQQPIKTVFLSVDFTDFIAPSDKQEPDRTPLLARPNGEFRYTTAGKPNSSFTTTKLLEYTKSLFSLDALFASVQTMVSQSAVAPDRDEQGFNPARDFAEAVRVEGPRALFDQKMSELGKKYSRPWYLRDAQGNLPMAFDDLHQFLSLAEKRGIRVYLFSNPFHQAFWTLMDEQGHMPVYHEWMQQLTELAGKHSQDSLVVWDFSTDLSYSNETVPAQGVKSPPLQWFWEPAHYRQELGDIMVDAMLATSCETEAAYGRRIF
jgi:hypothetical protein